jgi:UDP-N-acetylmuramyl pentapeptide phosphotransferase/UDP-N-acetylglucosamine-1-phosphate transferase
MNNIDIFYFLVTPFFLSLLVTFLSCLILNRMQILDTPNERSLHRRVVPRGGGLAIAIIFLGYQIAVLQPFFPENLNFSGEVKTPALVWLICGLSFAVMGGLDDLKSRSTKWRLIGQVILAILFVSFSIPTHLLSYSFFMVLAFLIVFIVNIFNFLDGADGYACSQAILFVLGYLFVGTTDLPIEFLVLSLVLLGTLLGFLIFNVHPARIFLGDLGSYFIGFQLVAFSIFGTMKGVAIAIPFILMAPFICDASLTLLKRIFKREKWWSAHREHAYQKLVLSGMDVRTLNVWLVAVNLGVCWPLAWLVAEGLLISAVGVLGVYVFFGSIWYYASKVDNKK